MLTALRIEDYGLIALAEIAFADGATIFTGETGSGKTMLLGALDFALGERAGADVVRRGAQRTSVTLGFDPSDALRQRLRGDGYELDNGEEATIVREVTAAGRSSIRLCGRPSTSAYVRAIAEDVAEVVGQHEAQRLLSSAMHLELLDRFGGDAALQLRAAVAAAHARAQSAAQMLAELQHDERRAQERYDDALAAAQEIEAARLDASEAGRLEQRRIYLDNLERITFALRAAREALADDERGTAQTLGEAAASLSGVADCAPELAEMAGRAAALQSDAVELAADLLRSIESSEYEPGELEAINERLSTIERLKRRYGGTIEDVVAHGRRSREEADAFAGRDAALARLRQEGATAQEELRRHAAALTETRRSAALALRDRVMVEFPDIALGSGRFEIEVSAAGGIGPTGADRVGFLFSANAGESVAPIGRVASGGERSRVLLALIVALAQSRDDGATLVFDEIDAGIGGATATSVGERIGALAKWGQVVCVTHLAQIATWADRHYALEKFETNGETTISVRELANRKERESEIARMLSGETHETALKHARTLLKAATVSEG
jgi:DNA repair protein RecN (Recombination protein N)